MICNAIHLHVHDLVIWTSLYRTLWKLHLPSKYKVKCIVHQHTNEIEIGDYGDFCWRFLKIDQRGFLGPWNWIFNLLMHQQILTPTFSFFLLLSSESFFLKLCFQHVTPVTNFIRGCVRVCLGVCGCGQMCAGVCGCGFTVSVRECVWVKLVYAGVHEWEGIHEFV